MKSGDGEVYYEDMIVTVWLATQKEVGKMIILSWEFIERARSRMPSDAIVSFEELAFCPADKVDEVVERFV